MPLTPSRAASARPALDGVLRELGSRIRQGVATAPEPGAACWPTGLGGVDRLLGGGFPAGRLCEVAGPDSSGRTSLALSLLARTTRAGALAALIDAVDALDPVSAEASGVDLARVLWVRAPGPNEALRAAEHVLATQGIPVVLVDLEAAPGAVRDREPARGRGQRARASRSGPPSPHGLTRLRKAAAAAQAVLVVLSRTRCTGAFADLALELERGEARFSGTPPLLEALEGRAALARSRIGPTYEPVSVRFPERKPDAAAILPEHEPALAKPRSVGAARARRTRAA